MQSSAKTVDAYIKSLPTDRIEPLSKLRKVILDNLPSGFAEVMSYGMIGYVVPLSKYPDGYHCNPELPLPFINIASQKNFIALYHMGLYGDPKFLKWFTDEYAKQVKGKLDMGKSCIRFKKPEQIPFKLVGELVAKISPEKWIDLYEKNLKQK